MPPVLLTRPAPQSARFAAALRDRLGDGLRIVISPLMAAEFLEPSLPIDGLRGLVFTSETGVAGFARLTERRDLPAHSVGRATADAARAAGLTVATEAGGDAGALTAALAGAEGPLLWPRGEDAAVDLVAALAPVQVRAAIVYRQAAQPATAEARALVAAETPFVLPLFSPRSAQLFAAALPDRRAPLFVAAMSDAVAAAARDLHPARIVVAGKPDAGAMVEALAVLIAAPPAA
jgi:uroporphyrinogen-III synthase